VEFTAEKEDASAVVFEATEAASGGLDGLDAGVKAFCHRICDTVLEVIEEPDQVSGESTGSLLEWLQARSVNGAMPILEELFGSDGIGLQPELDEHFLVRPGFRRLQLAFT